jgi:uncharacterized protein (TIGR01244 family)
MSSDSPGDAIVCRHGDIWFASQPSERDLDRWAGAGAKLVINSRTPEETAALPFDLPAAVTARGMEYAEMPIGGAWGANPEMTAALPGLIEAAGGPVVMHCRSGTRSAHLYAAHLAATGAGGENPFDTIGWPGGRDPSLVRALLPDPAA